ncbi:ATPase [Sorangium sp. So ce1128]
MPCSPIPSPILRPLIPRGAGPGKEAYLHHGEGIHHHVAQDQQGRKEARFARDTGRDSLLDEHSSVHAERRPRGRAPPRGRAARRQHGGFSGKLARRVIWASRIQLAAERDAADLVRTPFPEDEPALTREEIHALRDKIELLRVTQARWQAAQQRQERAVATFKGPAAEAALHRQTLLRFFDLRFKKSPEGQKRLMAIRAGSGDADLVQDVSDLLLLCSEHAEALQKAPRGEADAAARLRELSPQLARMLADKTLSPEAQRSRKLRDAAYTLIVHAERRLRAAAEYWYAGTDRMKACAPFPVSRGAASTGD